MIRTLEATFDGQVLRPDKPLELQPNTRVRITIETETPPEKLRSFLQTARSLNLQGPADWSARIEEYLYGRKDDAQTSLP
jgi:predicted DNA-binding antitoxin AbrB/MazE fold protein